MLYINALLHALSPALLTVFAAQLVGRLMLPTLISLLTHPRLSIYLVLVHVACDKHVNTQLPVQQGQASLVPTWNNLRNVV